MSAFEISLSQFMCVLLHRMIWENRMAVVVVLTDGGDLAGSGQTRERVNCTL